MSAGAGSFALTGQNVDFNRVRGLVADAGSFALTGQDATLVAGIALTGVEMTISIGQVMVYGLIVPAQDPNWVLIDPTQDPNWTEITPSDDPEWTLVA